jgi:hypothetical protein
MIEIEKKTYLTFNEFCELFDVSPNTMRKIFSEIESCYDFLQLTKHRKVYDKLSVIKAIKKKQKGN